MAIGIGSSFREDEDDDKPLFGRHWLEDSQGNLILSREQIYNGFLRLNREDKKWIRNKIKIKKKVLKK